jgi:hypothetical protein
MEFLLSVILFFGGIARIYFADYTVDDHNGAKMSQNRVNDGQKLLNIIIGIVMIIVSIGFMIYYFI